jgi:hypothetical protein
VTATLPPPVRTVDPDAINRLDDDAALPGDEARAGVFDAQCRRSYDAFQDRLDRVQRLAWLDAHVQVCDGCEQCEAVA